MTTKRSPTRTESSVELRALADTVRQLASTLEELYNRTEQLSKPAYDTGWTRPIGQMRGFGIGLQEWARALDSLAKDDDGDCPPS